MLSATKLRGMGRLGSVFFDEFDQIDCENSLERLAATMSRNEKLELSALLVTAAIAPTSLFSLLGRAERPNIPPWQMAILGPPHAKIKALCCLVYFDARDPTAPSSRLRSSTR